MQKLRVELQENSYDIVFEDSFKNLCPALYEIDAPKKLLIITDTNVAPLYASKVQKCLEDGGFDVNVFVAPAGEENKNMDTILKMCEACMDNRLDRKSMIIALGGGVIGDMAGFTAAIYMRGIRFVQIPTTLLSQSDSSVGGKTGIDFYSGKNILGAFHQPRLVYINVSTLKTLPEREFISGMGEVIKHGVIRDRAFFDYVINNADKIKKLESDVLIELSKTNCRIKAEVVSKDEKESGLRRILNMGHTLGHAVESACCFKKTHGQCVMLGMLAIFDIAKNRGLVNDADVKALKKAAEIYGFELVTGIAEASRVLEYVYKDKKKQGSKISFVLPRGIGDTLISDDISDEEIINALEGIKE